MVDNNVKQVIVIRKDLKMRKGKMAAQAAHASNKIILERSSTEKYHYFDYWKNNGMTKIVVGVDSEEELIELYQKAKEEKLPAALIVDAGLTEFDGISTKTCIAIGPYESKAIDKLTSHLKLL